MTERQKLTDRISDEYELCTARSAALANATYAMVADLERPDSEAGVVLAGAAVLMCRSSADPARAFDALTATLLDAWPGASRGVPESAETDALAHRVAYLESEIERIRPVYEAACAWRDDPPAATHDPTAALEDAVDRARAPR